MSTTCPICGFTYVRELPDDRAQHQHAHHQVIRAIDPKPTKRFLTAIRNGPEGEHVGYQSARWKNEEMYARARMFKREFGYDFTAWDITGNDLFAHGYLFNDDTGTFGHGSIAGACHIRWQEYRNVPAGWEMVWVWIAPRARRKGILSRRWPNLAQRFGKFRLSTPLSEAMTEFAMKYGHSK